MNENSYLIICAWLYFSGWVFALAEFMKRWHSGQANALACVALSFLYPLAAPFGLVYTVVFIIRPGLAMKRSIQAQRKARK